MFDGALKGRDWEIDELHDGTGKAYDRLIKMQRTLKEVQIIESYEALVREATLL